MAFTDPMDLSSPPRTPKPISRSLHPSTPFKSNATVISLHSTPESCDNINIKNNNNHDAEYHLTADFLESIDNYTDDFPPDFTSPTQHRDNKLPPLKLFRPRTFIPEHLLARNMQHISEVLDHMSSSLPPPSPPKITILLLLTPNPASLAAITDLENLATRFSADFSSATHDLEQEWHSINLYEYLHGWAVRNPLSNGNIELDANVDDVGIGSIHPYVLHAKLEKEREVNWRLALPIVKNLIDRQVKWGARRFVVCGLKLGDVEGVRGFAREIAEPAGIFALSSAPAPASASAVKLKLIEADAVPLEYMSRTVMIDSTSLSQPQTYDALLSALYAKQLSSTSTRRSTGAINHASSCRRIFEHYDQDDDEEEERFKEDSIMMDWM